MAVVARWGEAGRVVGTEMGDRWATQALSETRHRARAHAARPCTRGGCSNPSRGASPHRTPHSPAPPGTRPQRSRWMRSCGAAACGDRVGQGSVLSKEWATPHAGYSAGSWPQPSRVAPARPWTHLEAYSGQKLSGTATLVGWATWVESRETTRGERSVWRPVEEPSLPRGPLGGTGNSPGCHHARRAPHLGRTGVAAAQVLQDNAVKGQKAVLVADTRRSDPLQGPAWVEERVKGIRTAQACASAGSRWRSAVMPAMPLSRAALEAHAAACSRMQPPHAVACGRMLHSHAAATMPSWLGSPG
jgi:hypothetical protein